MGMSFHQGEESMHSLLRVPPHDNPTSTMLTPQASFMLQRAPLLALGTLDSQSRPWTTLIGGSTGFSQPLGGSLVGTRTIVDGKYDPVVQALLGGAPRGEMTEHSDGGKLFAGLAIDLMTRKRVKIAGRVLAGTVKEVDVESDEAQQPEDAPKTQDQIQLVTKIEQSLGNCPKYLNQYQIQPALVTPKILSDGPLLSAEGKDLIDRADMFFLSTTTDSDQDTNHRGGPPGFVRIIASNQIVFPEYSGNRLYQSLGNLKVNPKIGITFPDYATGDVLYITGTTEILIGIDAAALLPGSNLAVRIMIDEARYVQTGLPFRGERKIPSPYNPRVRPLASEGNIKSTIGSRSLSQDARLIKKTMLTPTIARFTFSVPGGVSYSPGQWAAFDFSQELDIGYEHMRDDDPTSLNDDFVRTFTISSAPVGSGKDNEFDITIRKVGPVTNFLFQQNDRAGFEVPVLGIGGEFTIQQQEGKIVPFVAGGVGITPLLGQLKQLDQERVRLIWTLKADDADLAIEISKQYPALAQSTTLFFTGGTVKEDTAKKLEESGAKIEQRRLTKDDLQSVEADTWYLCAGKPLRKQILGWLEGKHVLFEDFDY